MTFTTAIIIIASVILFFVLLFTIRVKVSLELQDELRLTVWAFGIRIRLFPRKQKKYRISDYTPKKIARRDAKAKKKAEKKAQKQKKRAQHKKPSALEEKAKQVTHPALIDKIKLFSEVANLFFSGLLFRLHFHFARIKIHFVADDAAKAAILSGWVYAALGHLLLYLDRHSHLHGIRNAEIDISPDYAGEKTVYDLKLDFAMSLGGFLGVLLKAVFKFIIGWNGLNSPKDKQEKQKNSNKDKKEITSADSSVE